jgi:L-fucose mutarotase
MKPVNAKEPEPPIWKDFRRLLQMSQGRQIELTQVERFEFYEKAEAAYAIVATSDSALYANIILKKGVVSPQA